MWAPEIGPSIAISTNSIAAVARVLASRATASFPWERFSAMMPEPITVANRKKAPSPSAASRRPRPGPSAIARRDRGAAGRCPLLRRQDTQRRTLAIFGRLAGGEEGLPYDPVGIGDPALFGPGVAAGDGPLLEHRPLRGFEPGIDLTELGLALRLDAEMLDAVAGMAGGDGEVDSRILDHPLGVIRLHHARFGREQGRVEADRAFEVRDPDMDVEPL